MRNRETKISRREKYVKDWRKKNITKIKQQVKDYDAKNKEALRDAKLRREYGITLKQYAEMLESQNGVCAICGKGEIIIDPRTGNVINLAVDHNPKTGKVRELLCKACNVGIGHFKESSELLRIASIYVEKHNAKP